ncbi:MAG: hypothetical protein HQ523_16055 [Lentisphaerae bacterium]|nr:hypothetical protein [Lentisphaerota bacterium]
MATNQSKTMPTDSQTHTPTHLPALWAVALLVALLLSALNLWFGELNQDEGWYLYSARLIADGQRPFVDFASTQGPVMSYVYALLWAPLQSFGLAGGRLVTTLMGWTAALLAARLAWRLGGEKGIDKGTAALLTFTLIGVNIYHAYFTTVVKTYALGSLLVVGAFLALTADATSRPRRGWTALAGLLLALAAGTRASLVMLLPLVFFWLLWASYCQRRPAAPWSFAAGAGITMLLIFLPFLLAAPQALWFGMVEYHAGRETGGLVTTLVYKAAFLLRTVRAYFVGVALLTTALLVRAGRGDCKTVPLRGTTVPLLVLAVGVVTLVHLLAPVPYDDYQAIIFPLFAVVAAIGATRALGRSARLPLVVLLLALLAAFSSPRCQDLFAAPRDRIWWPMRTQSPLAQLRDTAAILHDGAGAEGLILTQDTYLAVEAGLAVPAGMEMGPFCYYPDWPRERAEACHVLNREMLTELLATTPAEVAAFSEYGLSIASPSIQPVPDDEVARLRALLATRYAPTATIPAFGQAQTGLTLYKLNHVPYNGR